MPVTIRTGQDGSRIKHANEGPQEVPTLMPGRNVTLTPEDFETFGRLRLNVAQIASYYGMGERRVRTIYEKPQFRMAYDKGRAEIVMAVRQKQLKMALDGDRQMLLHAGVHFGEQDAEVTSPTQEASRGGQHWDDTIRDRARSVREKILQKTGS